MASCRRTSRPSLECGSTALATASAASSVELSTGHGKHFGVSNPSPTTSHHTTTTYLALCLMCRLFPCHYECPLCCLCLCCSKLTLCLYAGRGFHHLFVMSSRRQTCMGIHLPACAHRHTHMHIQHYSTTTQPNAEGLIACSHVDAVRCQIGTACGIRGPMSLQSACISKHQASRPLCGKHV
eukprot:GHUV01023518.1.p2 GENE.GHUV01023518.1~~GHUV01023518.1.p2  ORF type:complete len:182 (-),score=17.03 GHUV01023518.1:1006-1551(-)